VPDGFRNTRKRDLCSRESARSDTKESEKRGKTMKKGFLIGSAIVLVIGFVAIAHYVQAQSEGEVLYLSDTGTVSDNQTTLFHVFLNPVTGYAELTPLPDVGYGPGAIPFNYVIAFACTPDGTKIYCIESYSNSPFYHHLGVYDVASPTFQDLGPISGMDFHTAQAAFSREGILYIGNSDLDELWIVDTDPASLTYLQAIRVGPIVNQATDVSPNVAGADIVFGADGTLYLRTNSGPPEAPSGTYALAVPESPGTVWATYIGWCEGNFTGLAIRANGYGDLIGSITDPTDSILVIDKATADTIASFPMYLSGSPYSIYQFGDMSTGPLELCNKTIGYWKNHSWNNRGVTICGVLVQEEEGKGILWGARGNNYSKLFAQLIAAKLNTNNSTGIPEIEAAENYICTKWPDGWQDHVYDHISKSDKKIVSALWEALDSFNNQFPCE
jgi:hypothetical protein